MTHTSYEKKENVKLNMYYLYDCLYIYIFMALTYGILYIFMAFWDTNNLYAIESFYEFILNVLHKR